MRVALTGASGFLGRHLVTALAPHAVQVIAVSRHPDAPANPRVTPLALDIGTVDGDPFAAVGRPDVLVHLAWGGLPKYLSREHLELELPRQIRFLDACIDSGISRIVVAGTCLEYGLQGGELDETRPLLPTTAYGQAKCQLLEHLQARQREHGFALTWARLFYLYGSGQAPTSLYASLRAAVAAGAKCFDMSSGEQTRDFLAVEDAAARIAALAMKPIDAGIVNVCSGRPVTVIDRVRGWLAECGAQIELNRGVHALPDYEPFAFWGDGRRLRSLLMDDR
jgi:dTDP-6-deoxy-L-talose 4-dehydrogenase (NAD+)